MNPLVSSVDRLQRLAVFEAAARLGSFTAAATELGMTQPAVTRQIRALEVAIGQTVFDRRPNRVVLNRAGSSLLDAVQSGFTVISAGLAQLRPTASTFVLAANPGIAQRWLVPHLESLQRVVGRDDFHLWLFDRDSELARGGFDMAIHLGVGPWSGLGVEHLFPEVTVPVASPDYAASTGLDAESTAADLIDVDLLHMDSRDRSWTNWTEWFRSNGVVDRAAPPRVVYNNYALVVQDALAGRGVALGWRHLVDDLIVQGLLVEVGPHRTRPESNYNLLWAPTTSPDLVESVRAWLVDLIDA